MDLPSSVADSGISDPFKDLSLMEAALIMCLRKDGEFSHGTVAWSTPTLGVVAGILMELALRGLIEQKEGTEKFKLTSDQKTGDDILDEAIEIMSKAASDAVSIESWLNNVSGTLIFKDGIPKLKDRVLQRLVKNNVILREESKTLGITSVKWPHADTDGVSKFDHALRKAALTNNPLELDDRTLCVLGIFEALDKPFRFRLGNAIDINRLFPDKKERDLARDNLDRLFSESKSDASAMSISDAVRASLIRRMISVAVLGLFHFFRML